MIVRNTCSYSPLSLRAHAKQSTFLCHCCACQVIRRQNCKIGLLYKNIAITGKNGYNLWDESRRCQTSVNFIVKKGVFYEYG